jgi:hypothetical protein
VWFRQGGDDADERLPVLLLKSRRLRATARNPEQPSGSVSLADEVEGFDGYTGGALGTRTAE